MKGPEAKTLGLKKVIRHEYKRIVAFMLTVAMVVTNFGTNLTAAFAEGEEESSLFLLDSSELEDAISAALESGDVFDFSSLGLKAKQKSLKTSYEKLIGSKAGKVYRLDVDTDSSYAAENTDLQVFYNAGTDNVVFLFINQGDKAVTFRVNVGGFETARVTVNPNTSNIEDTEGVKNAEDYSSTTMVDDEKKQPKAEAVKPEGETSDSEENGSEETDAVEEETRADAAESETNSKNEETTGAENTSEVKGTDAAGEPEAEKTAAEESEEEKTTAAQETEAEVEETEAPAEENSEAEAPTAEEEPQPEVGSAAASISRKNVLRVSTSAEVTEETLADSTEDAEAEDKAEVPEKETEDIPEATEAEVPEKETEDIPEATEAEAPEKETETLPETIGAEETAADDNSEETAADESKPDETTTADENADDEIGAGETPDGALTDDKITDDGSRVPAENQTGESKPADESNGEVPADNNGENDKAGFDGDEQFLEDDSIEWMGELAGKAYNTVTIWGSANARAYAVKAEDLVGVAAVEGRYSVDYSTDPAGAAAIKGTHTVNEGETLYFAVDPQVGYEITEVTANGETLEEVDAADIASASNLAKYAHVYAVEEVSEDLEIVASLEETAPHPGFEESVTVNGVTITATAEEGILPEGTTLSVEEVTEQVQSAVKEKVEGENEGTTVTDVIAYDINLMLDGKKLNNTWGEDHYVTVNFSGDRIEDASKEADQVQVAALETSEKEMVETALGGTEEVSVIDNVTVDDLSLEVQKVDAQDAVDVSGDASISELSVEARHFTVYAVYAWYKPAATQITLKAGNMGGTGTGYNLAIQDGKAVLPDVSVTGISNTEGRDFLGWATSPNERTNLFLPKSEHSITNGAVLYAIWSYQVTFDPNASLNGSGTKFKVNVPKTGKISTADLPSDFSNSKNWMFVGWNGTALGHDSGAGILEQTYIPGVEFPGLADQYITKDVTLYAVWLDSEAKDGQKAEFYVRLDGKRPFEPTSYGAASYTDRDTSRMVGTLRQQREINNNPAWVKANILTEPSSKNIKAALNAKNIDFDPNTQEIEWYVIKQQAEWHVDGVIKDKQKYWLDYDPNGGTNPPVASQHAANETVSVELQKIPSRAGYDFLGWADTKVQADEGKVVYGNGSGQKTSLTMPDHNKTVYAVWKANDSTQFMVEHFLQKLDGTYPDVADKTEVKYGTTGTTVEDDTYQEEFVGFTYVSGAEDGVTSEMIDGNGTTVLRLYYTRNTNTVFTVEHYLEKLAGGYPETADEKEIKYGTTGAIVEDDAYQKEFSGFTYVSGAEDGVVSEIIDGNGTTILRLYYARKTYKVIYKFMGVVPNSASALPQETNQVYGTDITVANKAVASGYIFNGWNTTDAVVSGNKFTMPDHDVVLTGNFIASDATTYKVEVYYEKNGKYPSTPNTTDILTGTTNTQATVAAETYLPASGYVFDKNAANELSGTIAGDNSLVLRVYYKQVFKVTYEPGDHGSFKSQTYTVFYGDQTPEFSGDKTANGNYRFTGWDKTIESKVTGDIVYTAQWAAKSNDGGSNGGGGGNSSGGDSGNSSGGGSGSSSGGGGGSSSGPRDNGSTSAGGPGATTVTIDPDAVPLANLPNEDGADGLLAIDDEDVPLAALPKTGQSGANGLVFFLSSMMLAAFVAVSRKREDDK